MVVGCQVFEPFDLQIAYDNQEGRVELSATVSEAVAEAFEVAKTLLAKGSAVLPQAEREGVRAS